MNGPDCPNEPGTDNLVTSYDYDDATLTKTVTEIPQNGNPQRVNTFQYDAQGNLTSKTVDTGMQENHFYDADNRLYWQSQRNPAETTMPTTSCITSPNGILPQSPSMIAVFWLLSR